MVRLAADCRKLTDILAWSFLDFVRGMPTSKAFVREEANDREFSRLATTMYRASVRNLLLGAGYLPLVLVLAAGGVTS